ncbi:hypothetical protein F0344_18640 [Streptomyces finlayi]|uniref:Bacterial transcriptional activator domain-containing protein n=2 Tax=Streptomyces finlayi TaxID=67296 RepID=A0A7G7BVD8_9ACTN|nr:hypothetical protein F0344_18640 [Streptomyces finlayi]
MNWTRRVSRIWRGPAFTGIADVPALASEAARLDESRLGVLEERIGVGLRLGRPTRATRTATVRSWVLV